MICPFCGGKTGVFKTRSMPDSKVLRERRCTRRGCRRQFVTVETMDVDLGAHYSIRRLTAVTAKHFVVRTDPTRIG